MVRQLEHKMYEEEEATTAATAAAKTDWLFTFVSVYIIRVQYRLSPLSANDTNRHDQ